MLSNNEEFITAFKKNLESKNYIYIAPMNKKGSWAEIFFVFSETDEELRVAKVYLEPIDESTKKIYQRDVQKLIQYEHENIVKVYDRGIIQFEGNEFFYLILEHIKGKNLEEIGDKLFLDRPLDQRKRFFIQFLDAISKYRDDFEIHNDLHPGNILLSEQTVHKERKIKLIDPGSSKYTYKSGIEDFDLYLIKRQYLPFFFKPQELQQIGNIDDLSKLGFYELKEHFKVELEESQEVFTSEDIQDKCLNALEKIINYYFDNFHKTLNKPIENIPKDRRKRILVPVQDLNVYKDIANSLGIIISSDWNPESHGQGKDHVIFITIRNLIIKIIQHEFGEAKRITITLNGELVLNRELIEEELESITKYKEKNKQRILLEIKERIHIDYPFDEITVEFMDRSYYKYIESRSWNDASNQILYKLKKESSKIKEILKRLISISIYFRVIEGIVAYIKIEPYMSKYVNESLAIDLDIKFRQQNPQYNQNLMNELSLQIHNLKFISSQLLSLFSTKGIFFLLNKNQIERSVQFNEYYNEFGKDTVFNSIIDLGLPGSSYKTEIIEQSCKTLYNMIEKAKVYGLIEHLNEILSDFENIQRVIS